MITIVIPTMWKARQIKEIIPKLNSHNLIDKIIIINNDVENTPNWFLETSWNKVDIVSFGKNTYVNFGWNYGVQHSNTDIVCLLSDDIVFDTSYLFTYLLDKMGEDVGCLGVDASCYYVQDGRSVSIENCRSTDSGYGYGCMLFVNKKTYDPIPKNIDICCGDSYIILTSFRQNKAPRKLCNFNIYADFSVTSSSTEFKTKMSQDNIEFAKIVPDWRSYYNQQLDVFNNV